METKASILAEIDALETRIERLEDNLKYADHGAYGQDKERISDLKRVVQTLKTELEEGEA